MGWFDEQLRLRKEKDRELFEDSFIHMAGAVLGHRMSEALQSDRVATKNAIDEVLKYYHIKSREVPDEIKDVDDQLEYLMRPHGIMRRAVKLPGGWHKDAVGAMLGTLREDGSVVALLPAGLSGYVYTDPRTGKRVRVSGNNEKLFHEEAIAFYRPFPLQSTGIQAVFRYMVGIMSASDLAMLGCVTFALSLVGLLLPKINRFIFSTVVETASVRLLMATAIFLACVSISSELLETVKRMINAKISTKMRISVQAAMMMRVLSLPADFFKNHSAGELANRAQRMNEVCSTLIKVVSTGGFTTLFSLIYISQIFAYAPALVVPALTFTFLTAAVSILSAMLWQKVIKRQMETAGKESGLNYALISGVQKIRLSGAEKRAFAKWGQVNAQLMDQYYNPPMILKLNNVIQTAISLIGMVVLYYMAVASKVSIADYCAFNVAYGMVSGAFSSLTDIVVDVARLRPILDMVKPFLEAQPEVAEDRELVTRLSGGIELSNVSFRYSEEMPLIVDDLSLKIRPGQYVAIVGKTGCGKSTLLRLLLGFETPQKGAIYYDGKDMSRIDLKSLRRKIGVVIQNGRLFAGDIYSNIVISAPQLSVDDAWEAAELAGIAGDIRHMPMGMHTMISEGGGGVSGGQRQRLMIARAIAPKPKVLMFDEATSALDNITQKKVSESLDSLKCTRIVIAHRLSTIRQCDRIIVLDRGKIIEDGRYEDLIAKGGFFAELISRQRLDDGEEAGKSAAGGT